jgi:hypothetical protein
MKYLLKNIFAFVKTDFDKKIYAFVAIFIGIAIYCNYYLGWRYGNFEDSVLDTIQTGIKQHLAYLLFYSFPYYGTWLIIAFATNDWKVFSSRKFWIASVVGLTLLAIDGSFGYIREINFHKIDAKNARYIGKIVLDAVSIFTIFIPLYIFYLFTRPSYDVFYFGLHNKQVKWKPYAIIVLIMSFLVFLISFDSDFQNYYPLYNRHGITKSEHASLYIWIFEIIYGLDFISVELLFRGFLVIGIGCIAGKKALLPMVATYAFLHFGKPINESISSVFGGYILGVLAYTTRNIWGGVIVHMGTAWLMEAMAYFQTVINNK